MRKTDINKLEKKIVVCLSSSNCKSFSYDLLLVIFHHTGSEQLLAISITKISMIPHPSTAFPILELSTSSGIEQRTLFKIVVQIIQMQVRKFSNNKISYKVQWMRG
ncbi:hypothetical protein LOAG_14534, partial [Loa loa]